jgi:excisionase family DNA binding protein
MSAIMDKRIGPADITPEEQAGLERMLQGEVRPVLLTTKGDVIELPKALNDFFVSVVKAMEQKQAVLLMNEDESFTTQAAANFLGVSRQFFVRLLGEDRIPFHRVGTHRRVFFRDLVKFQRDRSKARQKELDAMTEDLVSAGVYDRFVELNRRDDE